MMGMMGGCMTAMGVLGLVLALGLLAGAVAVVSHLGRRAGRAGHEDRALAVLRERFARGEIDRAEYEERRTALAASEMGWA